MRLLTRSPKEKVPKSHLKWECDSKSNIIARFTPSPKHRSAHRYEFKLKLYILYIHFSLVFKTEIQSIRQKYPSTILWYDVRADPVHMVVLESFPTVRVHPSLLVHMARYVTYISLTVSHNVTCHAASGGENGNMKSLMIKWVFPHWFD